jgi:predicted nucleotidyltransferase
MPGDVRVTHAEIIEEMKNRIVDGFDPLRVILFGSHARGDAGVHSDVDFLVVFPAVDDRRRTAVEIRRALAEFPLCRDVVVTTPEETARRGDVVGSVLRPALREGRVLNDRG